MLLAYDGSEEAVNAFAPGAFDGSEEACQCCRRLSLGRGFRCCCSVTTASRSQSLSSCLHERGRLISFNDREEILEHELIK
jgi:hypothetical protein